MVLGVATAAAAATGATAATGGTLFEYNRRNFIYDRKMRQETEYQIMDFRIIQAELWREDIRDIAGLTSVKMETYLIVNAVQLGFCVMAFCEGRLAVGTPDWLIGCHTLALAGAFMYLLMSVWFSMHASVTAKSCEVRLLTQMVRLPVPSWAELEGARTYTSGFEKVDPRQILRVPFITGTHDQFTQVAAGILVEQPTCRSATGSVAAPAVGFCETAATATRVAAGRSEAQESNMTASDPWGLERRGESIYELDGSVRSDPELLRHFCLVREAMLQWQSYDGFARVAMSVGTNQLITALAYYTIGYVLVSCNAVMPAWLALMLFMVIATALIRLDMSITALEFFASVTLVALGPVVTAISCQTWLRHVGTVTHNFMPWPVPIAYASNALWLSFVLYICKVTEQDGGAILPTGFRSVMYIDVFGWIRRTQAQRRVHGRERPQASTTMLPDSARPAAGAVEAGCGPAVQALRYDAQGRPVPLRPEQLHGAAISPCVATVTDEERKLFVPASFVSRESDSQSQAPGDNRILKPGAMPWRIFSSATMLLISLWWICGALIFAESRGLHTFVVSRLLRPEERRVESGPEPLELDPSYTPSKLLLGGQHPDQSQQSWLQRGSDNVPSPFRSHPAERFSTSWPHTATKPVSLACANTPMGHVAFAATSRFGLFSATLKFAKDSARHPLNFTSAPTCEAIEGELLQDVVVQCSAPGLGIGQGMASLRQSSSPCKLLVLHKQGQRLASCRLEEKAAAGNDSPLPPVANIADSWLSDGDAASDQEEVLHIALARSCSFSSGTHCAFVETSSHRIVEVQTGLAKDSGSTTDWFPTRVIHGRESTTQGLGGGAMKLIGGRYLGVLNPGLQHIRIINTNNSADVVVWRLPEQRVWTAMCSTDDSLFLLSGDDGPQELWRFELNLKDTAALELQTVALAAAPATGHLRLGHRMLASQAQMATDKK